MKKIVLAFALSLTMGCASGILRPYIGEQQAWPTGQGSIVNTKYDLPVFTSLPPTPYDLVGELRIDSFFFAQPEEQHISHLVDIAKHAKADALVLVDGQIFFSINYGAKGSDSATTVAPTTMAQVNRFNPESFRPGVSVLAIKWLTAPPLNLPAKYKTQALPKSEPPKTDAPTESQPDKKDEKKIESPTPKTAEPAPKTNFTPAKPSPTPAPKPDEPKPTTDMTPTETPSVPATPPPAPADDAR